MKFRPLARIVVLDGFTLSPLEVGESHNDHPSWDGIASLGDLIVHPRTPASEVARVAAEAEILLTNKAKVDAAVIAALPKLRYIGVMATGTNVVDLAAASSRGIPVTNVPGYSTASVAQTVLALMLEVGGRTGETALQVRAGRWSECKDFCFTLSPWRELAGKTLGVFGYGAIGSKVADVALALGMRVIVHSRTQKSSDPRIEWVSRDQIFAESDVLSLHCPLVPDTERLIREETLVKMKPGAVIINTGRGPLLDEADVAAALHSGRLGGLGADVLSSEPPSLDNPLLSAPRTVITPHIAWASVEARTRLMTEIAANISAFHAGSPRNVVNN